MFKIKTLDQLESIAKGEADRTANQRLHDGWLRIEWHGRSAFTYWRDKGRGQFKLTRLEAGVLIDAQ